MADELVLGVDFGGTKIALGVVDAGGRVVDSEDVPSRVTERYEVVRDNLVAAVLEPLRRHPEIRRIGLGFKGPIDSKRGVSLQLVGIGGMVEGWRDVPVARLVAEAASRELGRDYGAWLENDATAAALGELWLGAAKGARD